MFIYCVLFIEKVVILIFSVLPICMKMVLLLLTRLKSITLLRVVAESVLRPVSVRHTRGAGGNVSV